MAASPSAVHSIARVLRCFTSENPLLGVTDIANATGLHKSSVSRLLAQLEQERFVERDEASRKYHLGWGLMAFTGSLLATLDVRRLAFDIMEQVRDETGETVALLVFDGREAITVEQVASMKAVKHSSTMGTRYTTALSASMQVFLAHLSEARFEEYVRAGIALDGARPLGLKEYREVLAQVRTCGVAINDARTRDDEVGVAAPIRDHRSQVVAALLVAAPHYRTGTREREQYSAAVRRAAADISRRLGQVATS